MCTLEKNLPIWLRIKALLSSPLNLSKAALEGAKIVTYLKWQEKHTHKHIDVGNRQTFTPINAKS
jgi:hypothetical protein